jgi:glycosyltransferase involved in cell wall biosynthesis
LHGVETIVRAAATPAGSRLRFRLIGDGQERAAVEELLHRLGVTNVELVEPVEEDELPREIAAAHVCLGVFGTTSKARRVVPNKVFLCAAVGRAIVTADTPAIQETFDGAVATVGSGDAGALATVLTTLDATERLRLGEEARRRFEERFSDTACGEQLSGIIRRCVGRDA